MNIKEVANKINKVRLKKVKALAKFIGVNKNQKRKELIKEIKNDYRYKIIINKCKGIREEKIVEFGRSINANVNQVSRTYIIGSIRRKCEKTSVEEVLGDSSKSSKKYQTGIVGVLDGGEVIYSAEEEGDKEKEGYVYVMVSSEKPNLVKIGMTKRKPKKRAKELSSSTGVSMPYIVAYKVKVSNPSRVESLVHKRLSDSRVNQNREFFEVETSKAIRTIEEVK